MVRHGLVARVLIGLGLVLLVGAAGIPAYGALAEWQHARSVGPGPNESLPARVGQPAPGQIPPQATAMQAAPMQATQTPTPAARQVIATLPPILLPRDRPTPPATPTAWATATLVRSTLPGVVGVAQQPATPVVPAPASELGPATWITIPKIGVAADVTQVGVEDGLYTVPLWAVGHHEDSANPGDPGNAVLNGHLETISAGHVFARLKDLGVGDAIYTYTDSQRLTWKVTQTLTAANTDRDFLAPTEDRRLTLYTCTGTFNPATRDFDKRLVVVAELTGVAERTP
jgi:LPXTG-site transpeptidase (sortase) family protein